MTTAMSHRLWLRLLPEPVVVEAYYLLVDRLKNVNEFDHEHRIKRIARDGGGRSCEEFVVCSGGESEAVVGDEQ